jgi:chromosomal replication initiation ATPase DnaA
MSTQADPFSPVLDVFHRLNVVAHQLAAAYAQVARLVEEHNALLAEAERLGGSVDPHRVIEVIAGHYRVTPEDLASRQRGELYVVPRQVAMWVLRRVTTMSVTGIGKLFDRDHGTVLFGDRQVEAHREVYPAFRAETDMLLQKARGSLSALAFERAAEEAPVGPKS